MTTTLKIAAAIALIAALALAAADAASAKTRPCHFTGDAWNAPKVSKLRAHNVGCRVADGAASNVRGGWSVTADNLGDGTATATIGYFPELIEVHGARWNAGSYFCKYAARAHYVAATCRAVGHLSRRVTMRLR